MWLELRDKFKIYIDIRTCILILILKIPNFQSDGNGHNYLLVVNRIIQVYTLYFIAFLRLKLSNGNNSRLCSEIFIKDQ